MDFENIDLNNEENNTKSNENIVEEIALKIEEDSLSKEEIVEEAEKIGGVEKLVNKIQEKIINLQKKIKVYTKLAFLVGTASLPAVGKTSEEKSLEKDGKQTERISEKERLLKKEIKNTMWSRAEEGLELIRKSDIEIFCLENPGIEKADANEIFQEEKQEVEKEFAELEKERELELKSMGEFNSVGEEEKTTISPEEKKNIELQKKVIKIMIGEEVDANFIPPNEDIVEAYKKGEFQNKKEFLEWRNEGYRKTVKDFIEKSLQDSSKTEKEIKDECFSNFVSFFGKVAAEEEIEKIYNEVVNE